MQRHVENYILALQERIGRGEIKATTVVAMIPALRLFTDMNEIQLNWRKIGKLLPSSDLVADDEAYDRIHIQKMLQYCDLRPIHDEKGEILAVHIRVYNGTESAYDTFATPEAWRAYCEYLQVRQKCGEPITKISPSSR
jgi:hypothetical protein